MQRSISRAGAAFGAAILVIALTAAPALACGGLIGPNGAVNLLRTTTLAAYHDGAEHYVTAFQFAGGGGEFGSLTPLPGVPSSVEKGGDWTLQRLVRETDPQPVFAADAAEPEIHDDPADADIVAQIRDLIDTRIRPAVANDGGDIRYRGFRNGVVYLAMQGACSGCPSSTATLKQGIEGLLKHYVPEVTEVRAA